MPSSTSAAMCLADFLFIRFKFWRVLDEATQQHGRILLRPLRSRRRPLGVSRFAAAAPDPLSRFAEYCRGWRSRRWRRTCPSASDQAACNSPTQESSSPAITGVMRHVSRRSSAVFNSTSGSVCVVAMEVRSLRCWFLGYGGKVTRVIKPMAMGMSAWSHNDHCKYSEQNYCE